MPDAVTLAALALLLLGKKKPASGSSSAAPAGGSSSAAVDGQKLLARAHQAAAVAWVPAFMDAGATTSEAAALARWAGLESSGNPNPIPGGNGGGLMQVGRGFVDMGALSAAEYARLLAPSTTRKEQAAIAIKYARWCADRAAALVEPRPSANPIDRVWFAYWYQQRPVDVRDVIAPLARQLSTSHAATLADALGPLVAKDAAMAHRLRAANVVAFDAPGAS